MKTIETQSVKITAKEIKTAVLVVVLGIAMFYINNPL